MAATAGVYVIERFRPDAKGEWKHVQLTFRADEVLEQLFRKACRNKSGKATAFQGSVKVKVE